MTLITASQPSSLYQGTLPTISYPLHDFGTDLLLFVSLELRSILNIGV